MPEDPSELLLGRICFSCSRKNRVLRLATNRSSVDDIRAPWSEYFALKGPLEGIINYCNGPVRILD
jgi:hypothetical protein